MNTTTFQFSGQTVDYHFDGNFSQLEELVPKETAIIITDENIFRLYQQQFTGWKIIVIKAGEAHKQQATVDNIIEQLIGLEAGRDCFIIGIGGGVVTDITGYVAGIYLRGVAFGLLPTTVLAMVDAAIGGKSGVDVGLYKNLVGLIRQPSFLLFDYAFLQTLPQEEWTNGFAEIIKHAAIKDATLFEWLEAQDMATIKADPQLLSSLIQRNVMIKTEVVVEDEFESGERKLLNFGHTFGHAIENLYGLPHGNAVSIGMVMAAKISEEINNFYTEDKQRLIALLEKYGLPVKYETDKEQVFEILKKDKKRVAENVSFVLLDAIGEASITKISLVQLQDLLNQTL